MTQKLHQVEGLENKFKNWSMKSGNAQGTANSYWNRIKKFKFFSLKNNGQREISGMINKQISTAEDKTAINQFLEFLFEEYEKDTVDDEGYEDLRFKKNSIKSNLEISKKERNRDTAINVKENYMHKDDFLSLLEYSEPSRAKLYYLLYSGAFRMGEIKRLTHAHVREDYAEHGMIKVPGSRSKSEKTRSVKFRSKYPIQVLEDVPTGEWEDENGEQWKKVFFPNTYSQLENYHLKENCASVGLSKKTTHSFRHVRITDLIQSTEMPLEKVQLRSGHELGSAVTKEYTKASFDREPETLENYCQSNGIDILEVIQS